MNSDTRLLKFPTDCRRGLSLSGINAAAVSCVGFLLKGLAALQHTLTTFDSVLLCRPPPPQSVTYVTYVTYVLLFSLKWENKSTCSRIPYWNITSSSPTIKIASFTSL
ncbi:hypothetical protein F2P81_018498 [Scophthalmus maximus]|uniref:Uncharacterized protein n=1 Tax=Scophthalmus maximus TaxID=52904 RepID=A0A6A4S4W3_SCOMX|nr:hypothetical protein F2P81_018498 [Scophthalmus maximus]